jgi:hypothetical protein
MFLCICKAKIIFPDYHWESAAFANSQSRMPKLNLGAVSGCRLHKVSAVSRELLTYNNLQYHLVSGWFSLVSGHLIELKNATFGNKLIEDA